MPQASSDWFAQFDTPAPIVAGNIDLSKQPRVKNVDGTTSTVRSISINEDGREILIPTVSPDGRVLSNKDAIEQFHKTGRHLGMFKTAADATRFAEALHESEAAKLPKGGEDDWFQQFDSETPKPPPKGVGDFLGNVVKSGVNLATNTLTGAKDTATQMLRFFNPALSGDIAKDMIATTKASPQIALALANAAKERYGPSHIGQTLYEDPLGVASDIASVAAPAAGALKLSKAPAVMRVANIASTIADLDPMVLAAKGVGKAARATGEAAVASGLRPPSAVRAEHGGTRQIARDVIAHRVTSEADAEAKLEASKARARGVLQAAQDAGHEGLPGDVLTTALEQGEAPRRATLREKLGLKGVKAPVKQRIETVREGITDPGRAPHRIETEPSPDAVDAALEAERQMGRTQAQQIPGAVFGPENPEAVAAARQIGPALADLVPRRILGTSQAPGRVIEMGGAPPSVKRIPLMEGQALKEEAQALAFESAKDNNTIAQMENRALARALKAALEHETHGVPAVGPINEQSQKLLGVKRAFEAAEDRPRASLPLALGEAMTGAATGHPWHGLAAAAGTMLLDSPKGAARTGIALDDVGKFVARPEVARLIQMLRARGATDDEIDRELTRAVMLQASPSDQASLR